MNLKKSDKIIAIVGVLILIFAAIALFFYVDGDTADDEPEDSEDSDMITFEITSDVSDPVNAIANAENPNFVIKNKLIGQGSWSGTFTVNHENLKTVSFFVDFTDNQAGLLSKLIKTLGADTLTVSILDENGNEIGSEQIKGAGNVTITTRVGNEISLEPILAENIDDARMALEERYMPGQELTYEVKLSLNTALFGKLRESLLKSDSFDLEVKYTYYKYEVMDKSVDGDDDDDDDDDTEMVASYRTLGYPGKN